MFAALCAVNLALIVGHELRVIPARERTGNPSGRRPAHTSHIHFTHAWLSTMPVTGLYV